MRRVVLLGIFPLFLVLAACWAEESPLDVVLAFAQAVNKKDTSAAINYLVEEERAFITGMTGLAAGFAGKSSSELMSQLMELGPWTVGAGPWTVKIIREDIRGNAATVVAEIRGTSGSAQHEIPLRKEKGSWRISTLGIKRVGNGTAVARPASTPTRPATSTLMPTPTPTPRPTSTPTPRPTATPTPLALSMGPPDFEDAFVDNRNGWQLTPVGQVYLEAGELHINNQSPSGYAIYSVPTKVPEFSGLIYESEVTKVTGPETGPFGLVFANTANGTRYAFLVGGAGSYSLQYWPGSGSWNVLKDWTPSSALNRGNNVNRLRVLVSASAIALYANDAFLAVVQDSAAKRGRIGVVVGQFGVHASFRKVRAWSVSQTPTPTPKPTLTPTPTAAPTPAFTAGPARAQIEEAVRRSNTRWAEAINNLDKAPLREVYIGNMLSSNERTIDRYRSQNLSREVRLKELTITAVQINDPAHSKVTTEEEWFDRLMDRTSGKIVYEKDPWSIYQTYYLTLVNDRWLVDDVEIVERSGDRGP